MPFPQQTARPFTQFDIELIKSGQRGVYGLFGSGKWIYVGRGDIKSRLLDHVNGDNPCITRQQPTHWVSELTTNEIQREKELIVEFAPICNQKVG